MIVANEKANKQNEEDDSQNIKIHVYDCPPRNLEDFLKLRTQVGIEDNDDTIEHSNHPLMFMVEHLLGQAYGLKKWKGAKCFGRISDILTVSDEAFVLLSIENCWEAIHLELEENDEDGNGNKVYSRGKYTSNGTNVKFGGWSLEGIKQCNDLYELVEKNRNEEWAMAVEKQIVDKLLNRYHRTGDATTRNMRRKMRHGKTREAESGQEVVQVKARSSLGTFGVMDPTRASVSV
jgi:hypothetical protein